MDGASNPGLAIASPSRPGFDLARDADEPEIRRVLRDNAMGGSIRLSLEREPDSRVAGRIEGPIAHQTIVGRRNDGRLFGIGTRSVRMAMINGRPTPLGYLGSLRLDNDQRRKPRVILAGYEKLRELHEADRLTPIYLTSILSDNVSARRLLEANLTGMPTYRFVSEFITLTFRVRRSKHAQIRIAKGYGEMSELLADRSEQFAPVWDAPQLSALRGMGLPPSAFRVAYRETTPIACAAAWNTTSFKQAVVRGYTPALRYARLLANALSRLTGAPMLPRVGEPLGLTFLSHVATPPDQPELIVPLVRAMNITGMLVAGFAPTDPRLALLRGAFGGREIRSRLYVVHWADGREAAESLDGRLCLPEVALL